MRQEIKQIETLINHVFRSRNNSFGGNRAGRLGPESIIESSVIPPTTKYAEDAYVLGEIHRPLPGSLHLDLDNSPRKPFLEDGTVL